MKQAVEIRAESGSHGGLMETIGWALLDTDTNQLEPHLYDFPSDAEESMPDLYSIIASARERVTELEPLVAEHAQLSHLLEIHDRDNNAVDTGPVIRATIGQPRPAGKPRAGKRGGGKRGRPKGSGSNGRQSRVTRTPLGTRGAQAIALLTEHGPLTIHELAVLMGIKDNYLYRVLPRLEKEQRAWRKQDGKWAVTGR